MFKPLNFFFNETFVFTLLQKMLDDPGCLPLTFQMLDVILFSAHRHEIIVTERKKILTLHNILCLICDIQKLIKILCSDETLWSAKEEWDLKNGTVIRVKYPTTFTKCEGWMLFLT